jgi:hypothetical protein
MTNNYSTWEEARMAVEEGKKVMFHHKGIEVLVEKNTKFQDLQWNYFGTFGLTWNDILNGKYSIVQ